MAKAEASAKVVRLLSRWVRTTSVILWRVVKRLMVDLASSEQVSLRCEWIGNGGRTYGTSSARLGGRRRTLIVHIALKSEWERAQRTGVYRSASLEHDGFIHCSDVDQVIDIANKLFRGQTDLALLCIDEALVTHSVKYEDLYQAQALYPHIYGALNLDAITSVVDFKPGTDGMFSLPDALTR